MKIIPLIINFFLKKRNEVSIYLTNSKHKAAKPNFAYKLQGTFLIISIHLDIVCINKAQDLTIIIIIFK